MDSGHQHFVCDKIGGFWWILVDSGYFLVKIPKGLGLININITQYFIKNTYSLNCIILHFSPCLQPSQDSKLPRNRSKGKNLERF